LHDRIYLLIVRNQCQTLKACPHWQQIVAENGNKLLPFSATICCRFWKQFVAENGKKVILSTLATICCRKRQQIVAENGNKLLPKTATICCRFWKQ